MCCVAQLFVVTPGVAGSNGDLSKSDFQTVLNEAEGLQGVS
jgi:hypothetical protein